MIFEEALAFDDVLLKPQFSNIKSRHEVSLRSNLGKIKLEIPIISSPMDTVTEAEMAIAISKAGGLGVIHRYNSINEQVKLVEKAKKAGAINIGAAIGITEDYLERAQRLVEAGANVICVDVAHGNHYPVFKAVRSLKAVLKNDVHVMAGNVSDLDGYNSLCEAGADSIRIGVGGGSICSTRIQTGHGIPTFTSIISCNHETFNSPFIADGGIKNSGDIVKSLAAGASFVMLGSLLAGTKEAPGDIMTDSKKNKYKIYRGMASKEAQIAWKGKYSSFEGVSHKVEYKGTLESVLDDLLRNVKSGLSYSGARSIAELQNKAIFIRQTSAGFAESKPHILTNGR